MAEYRKGSHPWRAKDDIQYHFVWVTKYRYHVLRGEVAERARELIRQSCMSREIKILKGHVSKDHIHLLKQRPYPPAGVVPSKPEPGEGDAVREGALVTAVARGVSTSLACQGRYWGQSLTHQGWARGYPWCAKDATVGAVTEGQIKAYIEAHDEESPEENFKISEPD